MYFYVILFFYTWKFWGSSFSSFRGLRVVGSEGLRFRGLRFRNTQKEVKMRNAFRFTLRGMLSVSK